MAEVREGGWVVWPRLTQHIGVAGMLGPRDQSVLTGWPDFDLPQEARERVSPGRVAKWVVSSLIPFRGLIRELSGANAQERAVQAAIQAGLARRGFLKGLGAARRCQYPAGPATPEVVKAHLAQNSDDDGANDKRPETGPAEERTKSGIRIVSEPVVQPLP